MTYGVCFCARGAVLVVEVDKPFLTQRAQSALGPFVSGGWLVDFNDAPGRTKEEVLAVFDKAIAAEVQ